MLIGTRCTVSNMAEPLTPFGLDFSKSSLFFLKLLVCASDDLVGMVDDEEVLFDPIFFRTITGGTLSALSYQPIGGASTELPDP